MQTSHGQSAPDPQESAPTEPALPVTPREFKPYNDGTRPVSQPSSQTELVGLQARTETQDQRPEEAQPQLPPDLRSPLHIVDLVALVFFYVIAGALIIVGLDVAAPFVFRMSSAAQNSADTKSLIAVLGQVVLSGATLLFLYGLVRARTSGPFWPAVGWRRFKGLTPQITSAVQFLFVGSLLAVVSGWASSFMDRDVVLPMEELLRSRQSVILLMALGVLVAPAIEETIFRGCIYPILARRMGIGAGVFTTGLLFGLAHAPQLWPGYGQVALLIIVGIVLTYVRARTGTVLASYLVHLGYNMLLFGGFFWSTGALRHLPS